MTCAFTYSSSVPISTNSTGCFNVAIAIPFLFTWLTSVCGGAVATSTIAANAIVELAKENNIDIEIAQVRISEIASNLPADLIVTTSKVKRDFGVPLITGMPFVSGLGVDKTKAKILEVLNK